MNSMGRCRRHPRQLLVGVCASCLRERLQALLDEEELGEARDSFGLDMPPMTPPHLVVPRRDPMEYNRENVKQVAALYLQKHLSFTSSPQCQPTSVKSRQASPPPLIQSEKKSGQYSSTTPKKKRTSLWSLLQRHVEDKDTKRQGHEFKHEPKSEIRRNLGFSTRQCKNEADRDGSSTNRIEHRRSLGSSCRVQEANQQDSKVSYTTSMREVHDSLSKGDASSLLSSPHHASPKSSKQLLHFPSPTTKRTIPNSPLRKEASLVEDPGVNFCDDVRDNYNSTSWMASIFPRRSSWAKSLSGSAVSGVSQPRQQLSTDVPPDMVPRRKSVSFVDEHMCKSPKHIASNSPMSVSHPHDHRRSHIRDVNADSVAPSYFSDSIGLRSPKMKLAGLLSKRRSSVSIDCSRDMRVSPAPIFTLKQRDQQQQQRSHHHFYNSDMDVEVSIYGEKPKRKSLLKSPSKYVATRNQPGSSEDEERHLYSRSRSWSKAWSKTLSPMLGFKHKKKQSNRKQEMEYTHPDHHYRVQHHHHQHQQGHHCQEPTSPLHHDADFFVQKSPVLSPEPAMGHKRPPQHYSFLNKDYSAFSFYFSPTRSGQQQNSFTDAGPHTPHTPHSRHSVDGSYPSFFGKGGVAGRADKR